MCKNGEIGHYMYYWLGHCTSKIRRNVTAADDGLAFFISPKVMIEEKFKYSRIEMR